jgi:hypothetical protein
MLTINERLGFRAHRPGADYQMSRDQLAARIQALGLLRDTRRCGRA